MRSLLPQVVVQNSHFGTSMPLDREASPCHLPRSRTSPSQARADSGKRGGVHVHLPSKGAIMGEHQKRQQPGVPWNKGKLIGQKAPLKLKEIWAIRIR